MFTVQSGPCAGIGHVTGAVPGRRAARGSPAARRAISSIRPGTASWSPAARWSRSSGMAFTAAIGLAAEFVDDRARSAATKAAVAAIIAAATPTNGGRCLPAADCCVTIVATLEEALRDPHFVGRGLFEHVVARRVGRDHAGAAGADRSGFRAPPETASAAGARRRQQGLRCRRVRTDSSIRFLNCACPYRKTGYRACRTCGIFQTPRKILPASNTTYAIRRTRKA